MNVQTAPEKLKPNDYASDQEVRWCPGCGDYAIVNAVKKALANMQADPKNTVFIGFESGRKRQFVIFVHYS